MADISKVTLPSGNTYNIKDQHAREMIDDLPNELDITFDVNQEGILVMTWIKQES